MTATKGKHGIGKRSALVICVAAVGVMALGAQTVTSTPPGQAPPTCKGLAATIVGTADDENLVGTRGPDVIVGSGGSDITIDGGRGNDVICGGKGADFLWGGLGKDTLLGQAGGDQLNGGEGKDRCEGGKGNDSTEPVCEVEKSIEKSGFTPSKFH